MRELRGRVAVVTGAASGIGRALAERFAAEGMRVVLSDVEAAALDAAVASLRGEGAEAIGVRADVSRLADLEALAAAAVAAFGGVDVVCNNAGVDSGAPFSEIPLQTWEWVLGVDAWGVINGCRVFLPLLRERGEGHIVNTASLAALSGFVPTATPYVASKFAVLGLSENLFHELAATDPAIGVSVLIPTFVNTRMPFSERNRPAGVPALEDHPRRRPFVEFSLAKVSRGQAPAEVAEAVVAAIRERRFYVLPDPEPALQAVEARLRWMRTNEPPAPRAGRPTL